MKLTQNDMRVLRSMQNVLHPSRGGNGDFDGFIPHGARDWIAIRRLLREGYVEQSNEYGTCQTCSDPHEDTMFTLTHWAFRLFAPEEYDCPFCGTPGCPRFAMLEQRRKNPPRGMGAGLWMHGEPFREAHDECMRRRTQTKDESWEYRCRSCGANMAEVMLDGVKLPRVDRCDDCAAEREGNP